MLINPSTLNNFGIKTTPVIRSTIAKDITIYGYISKINSIGPLQLTSKVTGVITQLVNDKQYYAQGETVFVLESDAYVQAQKAYIAALAVNDVAKMRQFGRDLRKMDFDQQALKQLGQNRQASRFYHFKAPKSGQLDVSNLHVGQKLKIGSVIGELVPRYPIAAYAKVF